MLDEFPMLPIATAEIHHGCRVEFAGDTNIDGGAKVGLAMRAIAPNGQERHHGVLMPRAMYDAKGWEPAKAEALDFLRGCVATGWGNGSA